MLSVRFPRWVDRFDEAADRAFDRVRGRPGMDKVFYSASALGDHSLLWHLLGAARGLRSELYARQAVRLSLALGAESALVNGLLKSLVRRHRPTHADPRPRHLRQPRTSSFPSGHASSGFTAAGILATDDPLAPLYYSLAVVVAASRVYTRIHHASDVVAGALVGLALARALNRYAPLPPPPGLAPTGSARSSGE